VQKYINYWFSSSPWISSAARSPPTPRDFFATGLKGRYREGGVKYQDHARARQHVLRASTSSKDGRRVERKDVPLRNCPQRGAPRRVRPATASAPSDKWNRALKEAGVDVVLTLPSRRFNRSGGLYAGMRFSPSGEMISEEAWAAQRDAWLPTVADRTYVKSLMTRPVYEPGKMAHWLAPPKQGIKGTPLDFEYVRHHA
jgi:benzoyl-CoA 2,3-dioxygenase component B